MSRNYLLSNFYYNQKNASHLLFLDDDMGFPESLVFDMIDSGEPLLGVVYPKRAIDLQKLHSLAGESFEAALAKATEFIGAPSSFRTGLRFVEVERVGTGVMLISRACIDTMIEKCPDIVDTVRFKRFPFAQKFQSFLTPFDKIKLDDREYSEDFSFCYRWKELCGGKVLASVTDEVTHVGQMTVRSKFYNRFADQIAAKTAELEAAAAAASALAEGKPAAPAQPAASESLPIMASATAGGAAAQLANLPGKIGRAHV